MPMWLQKVRGSNMHTAVDREESRNIAAVFRLLLYQVYLCYTWYTICPGSRYLITHLQLVTVGVLVPVHASIRYDTSIEAMCIICPAATSRMA